MTAPLSPLVGALGHRAGARRTAQRGGHRHRGRRPRPSVRAGGGRGTRCRARCPCRDADRRRGRPDRPRSRGLLRPRQRRRDARLGDTAFRTGLARRGDHGQPSADDLAHRPGARRPRPGGWGPARDVGRRRARPGAPAAAGGDLLRCCTARHPFWGRDRSHGARRAPRRRGIPPGIPGRAPGRGRRARGHRRPVPVDRGQRRARRLLRRSRGAAHGLRRCRPAQRARPRFGRGLRLPGAPGH